MAQVEVEVAGRPRRLACADGQEARLRQLAAMVDSEARALSAQMTGVGDAQLMLMAALMLADRLGEATEALRAAEAALAAAAAEAPPQAAPAQDSPSDHATAPAGQPGLFDEDEARAALFAAVDRLERLVAAHEGGGGSDEG